MPHQVIAAKLLSHVMLSTPLLTNRLTLRHSPSDSKQQWNWVTWLWLTCKWDIALSTNPRPVTLNNASHYRANGLGLRLGLVLR